MKKSQDAMPGSQQQEVKRLRKALKLMHAVALRESNRLAYMPHTTPNSTDWKRLAETIRETLKSVAMSNGTKAQI